MKKHDGKGELLKNLMLEILKFSNGKTFERFDGGKITKGPNDL